MVQDSNRAKTCHQSEKDDTMLKHSQNLSPVSKTWYNTETVEKPVTSEKKMVQYSNRAKTCHHLLKDGAILKQCQNLITARKSTRYNSTIVKQGQNLSPVRKR